MPHKCGVERDLAAGAGRNAHGDAEGHLRSERTLRFFQINSQKPPYSPLDGWGLRRYW
jgi:hypothetical protein